MRANAIQRPSGDHSAWAASEGRLDAPISPLSLKGTWAPPSSVCRAATDAYGNVATKTFLVTVVKH
jgi:hypothetical protein